MPHEPGVCPSCGADWTVGPSSKGRADVAHCQCLSAVGGVHMVNGCQQCGYSELAEWCADPSRRSRAFSYERPTLRR